MLAAYLGVWPILVFVWALAVTTGTTFAQTTSTFPATVEFDLVFPRNETYAADALLPIVFAVQNPEAVVPLAFGTSWSIYRRGIYNDDIASGYRRNMWTNYSTVGNEPYFETFVTDGLNGTEGLFTLVLDIAIRNCTYYDSSLNFGQVAAYARVDFELRNGAQRPSVLTPTDSCPVGIASVGITSTINQSTDQNYYRDTCAVLADPAPKMNLCAVKIDSTVASRVSASACALRTEGSNCSSSDDESNTAAQSGLGSMGWPEVVVGLVLGVALLAFHR
ncbi:hypothetical protein V500_05257 [Pseudogymnoascus sp. VKM F-4518 (FW-2643)]|nr:hypothetical protein V500_05257 [Pseudogymnoascus sp. VKM F-4518 (FW-2643)]